MNHSVYKKKEEEIYIHIAHARIITRVVVVTVVARIKYIYGKKYDTERERKFR